MVRVQNATKQGRFTYHDHFYLSPGRNCGPDIVDLTLTQLRVFVAVAEAGSLRAAARSLGIAQSGVTQQLRKLETNAGGPLFERGHRGARLTSVGERLRIRADVILGECVRTENEMRQLRGELTGQVSLGVAAEAMMRLFPALLAYRRSPDQRHLARPDGLGARWQPGLRLGAGIERSGYPRPRGDHAV
jgi:DNA-binding transcriptional LysR family regulator